MSSLVAHLSTMIISIDLDEAPSVLTDLIPFAGIGLTMDSFHWLPFLFLIMECRTSK